MRRRLLLLLTVAVVSAAVSVTAADAAVVRGYASSEAPTTTNATAQAYCMSFLMSAANVQINGLQLYRAAGESSASHILRFYEGSGILLTSVNATLSAGWNEATVGAPITPTAGARRYPRYNAPDPAAGPLGRG